MASPNDRFDAAGTGPIASIGPTVRRTVPLTALGLLLLAAPAYLGTVLDPGDGILLRSIYVGVAALGGLLTIVGAASALEDGRGPVLADAGTALLAVGLTVLVIAGYATLPGSVLAHPEWAGLYAAFVAAAIGGAFLYGAAANADGPLPTVVAIALPTLLLSFLVLSRPEAIVPEGTSGGLLLPVVLGAFVVVAGLLGVRLATPESSEGLQ